ncbi:hypothetical protein EAG_02992 [Camponotus floridanus]|uniref:Uncharacterized protein n=1 Tax=Camponotus floridanus TaxID=104421 RepID=E2AG04_CAMFO|nr:hypothetical protein EAG_02992 [Camponotus floridanus]
MHDAQSCILGGVAFLPAEPEEDCNFSRLSRRCVGGLKKNLAAPRCNFRYCDLEHLSGTRKIPENPTCHLRFLRQVVGGYTSSIHYGIGLRNARFMERILVAELSPACNRDYRDGSSWPTKRMSQDENVKEILRDSGRIFEGFFLPDSFKRFKFIYDKQVQGIFYVSDSTKSEFCFTFREIKNKIETLFHLPLKKSVHHLHRRSPKVPQHRDRLPIEEPRKKEESHFLQNQKISKESKRENLLKARILRSLRVREESGSVLQSSLEGPEGEPFGSTFWSSRGINLAAISSSLLFTEGVKANSSKKKALVAYESFLKLYNKIARDFVESGDLLISRCLKRLLSRSSFRLHRRIPRIQRDIDCEMKKEKRDELTEYSKGGGIEIAGKTRRRNKGEDRKEADAGDTHLRAWDRAVVAAIAEASLGAEGRFATAAAKREISAELLRRSGRFDIGAGSRGLRTGCPRLSESAVNGRFLRSFGDENFNTKMLRKTS